MHIISILFLVLFFVACAHRPFPGPDKQFAGGLEGVLTGAGAGAVTGAQVTAGSGPGVAVGAGIGAVAGGIQGMGRDLQEEALLRMQQEIREEKEKAYAQEALNEHFKRRMELHPTRDIFPADLFFYGDEVKLRPEAVAIVRELARLNKERMPWSRLVVAAYAKENSNEEQNTEPSSETSSKPSFAKHLAEHRSRELCDALVRGGIEPRRLQARAVTVKEPILIDPNDRFDRYNQALEIIALDR